jgi:HEAT repeat protein
MTRIGGWGRLSMVMWLVVGSSAVAQETNAPVSQEASLLLEDLDAHDLYVRQRAFLRLEALREPATAAMIRQYLAASDVDTRAFSVRALAAIEGPAAIPQLLQSLRADRDPAVRRAALLGLEPLRLHDPSLVQAFIVALRDRKPEVRMTAVDVVSRIDDPAARDAIRRLNKREYSRNVRRALALAMKRLEEK